MISHSTPLPPRLTHKNSVDVPDLITPLLFGCEVILQPLSSGLTLEPGDIIATGTPSGVAMGRVPQPWLKDGDVIEAEIAGIGVLRNTVRGVR